MTTTFIGIDPGKRGAIVARCMNDTVFQERLPWLGKAGMDCAEVAMWLMVLRDQDDPVAVIERAQAMPGQGVSSMFKYGRDYGALLGILAALRIPHTTVTPRTWQKAVHGVIPKGANPKDYAIQACRQRLPDLDLTPGQVRKPHDGLADAGCLALYAQQVNR